MRILKPGYSVKSWKAPVSCPECGGEFEIDADDLRLIQGLTAVKCPTAHCPEYLSVKDVPMIVDSYFRSAEAERRNSFPER